MYFFFSSGRRHTSWPRDWSSDVCSSDLRQVHAALGADLPEQIDDTTWQVTLRDGAVFHDGTPVTADDVVYSFERVMDPENNSFYRDFIDFLDSVEAVDENTVQFNLGYAFSLVPERLSVVKVVPEDLVESDYEAFNSLPVGTGPYQMTSATPDDAITFDRFDEIGRASCRERGENLGGRVCGES